MDHRLVVSVVIPVYNAEKYIERAIESVLCQLNGQVELILVDDGAHDSSGKICDAYAVKHRDIHVIHKVNGGSSSARNAGMAVAKGEYIAFMDADDYLEPETCQELIKVIEAYRPDCIDFGWKYVSCTGEISNNLHKLPKGVLLGDDVLRNTILPPLLHLCADNGCLIYEFTWNKVYRREIIKSKSVSFDEGRRTWEDRIFVATYLKYCHNYYSMNECFYNYVYAPGSLSQQYSLDLFRIILVSFQQYVQLYGDEYDFDTQYVNNHWCCAIESMIVRSLDQTQDVEVIKSNILNTLRQEQVIHWFANRTPENEFEKQVSALVVAGKVEEALRGYEKEMVRKRRRQTASDIKGLIKRGVRKIVRR